MAHDGAMFGVTGSPTRLQGDLPQEAVLSVAAARPRMVRQRACAGESRCRDRGRRALRVGRCPCQRRLHREAASRRRCSRGGAARRSREALPHSQELRGKPDEGSSVSCPKTSSARKVSGVQCTYSHRQRGSPSLERLGLYVQSPAAP